jgi:hypothetical protein
MVEPAITPEAGLTCELCGDEIVTVGKQNMKTALGVHKRKAHGIASETSRSAKASRRATPSERPPQRPSGRAVKPDAVVRDIPPGTGGPGDSGSSRRPSAAELEKAMAKGLVGATWQISGFLSEGDPRILTAEDPEEERDRIRRRLTMPARTAAAVAKPVGKVAARSKLNAKVGRRVLDAAPAIAAIASLGDYLSELAAYRRERILYARGVAPLAPSGPPPAGAAPPGPAPAGPAAPAGPPPGWEPPAWTAPEAGGRAPDLGERRGIVATPDMAAMAAKLNGRAPQPIPDAQP